MSDGISIRAAVEADAARLAALCTQLGYPATPDVLPGRLARLARDPGAAAFVATLGGEVVGLATLHVRATLNHDAPIAQLTLLVVDERTRSAGVGRRLVQAVESEARTRGCRRLAVTTALDRAGAHGFYERLEFRHTGRRYAKDLA